jgi:exosortase C (VPDSG-CTERM-specific)
MSKPLLEMQDREVAAALAVKPRGVSDSRRHVIGVCTYILLLTVAFAKLLGSLAIHAANSDLHSYLLLVPLLSGYLLYERRQCLPRTYSSAPGWAILPLLIALISVVAANQLSGISKNDYLTLTTTSFVFFIFAGVLLFLGKRWFVAAAFPIAFLIFLVPMPDAMADALESASKIASAEAASLFFDLSGTPVLRDGTLFQLPNISLRVAQECSGIRSSWVLMITSLVAANVFLRQPWRRAVLVCCVIPLGILRNGFRVFVIGMLCVHISPDMVNSIIHHRGGPLFFTLSLIPLFGLLWWLRSGDARARTGTAGN